MPPPKKPMPVGIEDFKEIVAGGYHFVDKTGFIKEHMDHRGQVTLITRPRRFGKTLTLSMLLYFYTLEQGEENRRLFCGLDIEKAGSKGDMEVRHCLSWKESTPGRAKPKLAGFLTVIGFVASLDAQQDLCDREDQKEKAQVLAPDIEDIPNEQEGGASIWQ